MIKAENLKVDYQKILIKIIKKHVPTARIYLYGSRARGDHSMGSDIDVALDARHKIERLLVLHIKDDIEESTIPLFVDVIDLHNISETFKNEITPELQLLSD